MAGDKIVVGVVGAGRPSCGDDNERWDGDPHNNPIEGSSWLL